MDSFNYKYMDTIFLEEYKALESLEIYKQEELQVVTVENGVVLPCRTIEGKKRAGIIDADGSYIALSAFQALSPVDAWGGAYEPEEEPEMIEESVLYFGRYWKHWGHFLMDMVSRLWYFLDHKDKIRIVYDSEEEIRGVYLEFLELFGISSDQLLRIDKPTRFSKIIVPECSHKPGISCNDKYKEIFERVAENALLKMGESRAAAESVYFTRTHLKQRIPLEVGEKDIEKLFERNDFFVAAPEELSLAEQISLIRNAKRIACIAGTLPHNLVFAKDGTELIVIRKTNKPNYRQVGINQMKNLKVVQIDAHISLKAVGPSGPFILDVNQNVINYFKDNLTPVTYSRSILWLKRKIKILWYIPIYILRNRSAEREVPLFDGKGFSTTPSAKKDLYTFYKKRI